MRYILLCLCVISSISTPTFAKTTMGRCVLQVKQKTYLDQRCRIEIDEDSISIGTGQKHASRYFAYVNIDADGAHGYWNEEPDATHAHTSLGLLKRQGSCWVNEMARVCAYYK